MTMTMTTPSVYQRSSSNSIHTIYARTSIYARFMMAREKNDGENREFHAPAAEEEAKEGKVAAMACPPGTAAATAAAADSEKAAEATVEATVKAAEATVKAAAATAAAEGWGSAAAVTEAAAEVARNRRSNSNESTACSQGADFARTMAARGQTLDPTICRHVLGRLDPRLGASGIKTLYPIASPRRMSRL
jgi:hypothetical protein